jgi:purine-binding chemotaxis protein CheW
MIILRLEDHVIAVIVETIEKVVGVFKDEIQPPHPLFGDINIKYINGVVEKNERLYVILDVEKIFNSRDTPEIKVNIPKAMVVAKIDVETPLPTTSSSADFAAKDDINLKFISETLATFKVFYPSEINQKWLKNRFKDWANIRNKSGKDVQFSSEDEAKAFIKGFYSPYPNTLWDKTYADIIAGFIDKNKTGNFTVWNPGCGKGSETYSLSVMLKEHNSKLLLKILANDNDLISISTAPGLIIPSDKLDSTYKKYTVEGSNGVQFNKEINSSIDGRTNWKMEEKDNIKIYRKK